MVLIVHSLDFSDDSVSTTTGRPSAWTIRYSAPEVLDCEPRNRASDIFSLGCVLIEMALGLYGYSLSEVKDHWKKTGNGQSSFACNTEATSSWLASLSDHLISGRLIPIVDYLPALLVTRRLDRPSAQAVVDRLGKLSQLHPDPPHHVNTCCGSPPGLMDNLRPGRVEGSGLLGTLDPSFLDDVRRYFGAVADTRMSYIVLNHHYNHVTSKHAYQFYAPDTRKVYIHDFAAIKDACAMLLSESKRKTSVLDQARSPNDPRITLDRENILLARILQMYASRQAIFTALRAKLYIPESVLQQNDPYLLSRPRTGLRTGLRTRTIQIAMVDYGRNPHGERCFDAVFYVLAFSIFDVGYDPSSLGAPFVDLARTSSN
jgi:serine/threonine protein kinase